MFMKQEILAFRSPLGRVRGRGSAREGAHHWWMVKLSSLALVPLTIWFILSVLQLVGADQASVQAWLKNPFHAVGMLLFLCFGLQHSSDGIQVVIEDYFRAGGWLKIACLILNKVVHLFLVILVIFAVLLIALKG